MEIEKDMKIKKLRMKRLKKLKSIVDWSDKIAYGIEFDNVSCRTD